MTQFLLADGVVSSLLPTWVHTSPASNNPFLQMAAKQLFGGDLSTITAVLCDGEEFDVIIVRAQKEMIEGKHYESTRLNLLLTALSKASKRIALWYGNDYESIETVNDFDAFMEIVREGLASPSAEIYAIFTVVEP
jgi:hypothetical protein